MAVIIKPDDAGHQDAREGTPEEPKSANRSPGASSPHGRDPSVGKLFLALLLGLIPGFVVWFITCFGGGLIIMETSCPNGGVEPLVPFVSIGSIVLGLITAALVFRKVRTSDW